MRKKSIIKDLSSCEKVIMKAVWDSKGDISTQDLIERLRNDYNKDYARTTVVTFVQRLVEKKFVSTYRKGRLSYVHAEKREKDYKKKLLSETTDFWFKGDASDLVSALCNSKKISKTEIERIRKTIDELDD